MKKQLALFSLPLFLASFFLLTFPFKDELVSKVFSLRGLNSSQQFNIELACRALNNLVLQPGEQFSFNKVVGPRSDARGYRSAPSYLGPNSPSTSGGGICLVSSALYQAALASGMRVSERLPHLRTISSVTPGLDATVWYGRADLKFINESKQPLQIKTECKNGNFYLRLYSQNKNEMPPVSVLRTVHARQNRNELLVEVFKENAGKRSFVSRDLYQLH